MLLRRLVTPLAISATLLAAVGCSTSDDEGSDGVTVAAAFYPLAWVAEQVGGEHVSVTNLTKPGAEAHDASLSIAMTAQLSEADVVVLSGGFQPEIDAAAKSNASGTVLDVTDFLELIPTSDDHGDHGDSHEGHDHGPLDPHFWLDPLLMADYADHLATELGKADPDHAEAFTTSAADLRSELENLDSEYTAQLASCEVRTVVVSHDAFGYLARYGLDFEPVAGLSPGAEPTPSDLKHLSEVITDEGLTTVFTETLAPTKLTEQLAADAGVDTAGLDPVEGLTDSDSGDDYLSLMRSNLSALVKANRC